MPLERRWRGQHRPLPSQLLVKPSQHGSAAQREREREGGREGERERETDTDADTSSCLDE